MKQIFNVFVNIRCKSCFKIQILLYLHSEKKKCISHVYKSLRKFRFVHITVQHLKVKLNLPCKIEKTPKLYIAVSCHSNPQTRGKTTVDLYMYMYIL